MKRETELRELFISNAIHLIAEGGFEKATTKELTHCGGSLPEFKMNEVYIYRIFGSKEHLYEEAFLRLDLELYGAFRAAVVAANYFELGTKEELYDFFIRIWEFLLRNEERCRCYVRYYYSIYFKGDSLKAHTKHFHDLAEEMSVFFKEEADVDAILHSVFTALLAFAIRVYNGQLIDNEINRPHIFNVLYCMMMTYFKDEEPIPSLKE